MLRIVFFILYIVPCAFFICNTAESETVPQRLERLERDVNSLQRRIFRGESIQSQTVAPVDTAVSESDVNKAFANLPIIEQQLASVTDNNEVILHRIDLLEKKIEKISADIELRFAALEKAEHERKIKEEEEAVRAAKAEALEKEKARLLAAIKAREEANAKAKAEAEKRKNQKTPVITTKPDLKKSSLDEQKSGETGKKDEIKSKSAQSSAVIDKNDASKSQAKTVDNENKSAEQKKTSTGDKVVRSQEKQTSESSSLAAVPAVATSAGKNAGESVSVEKVNSETKVNSEARSKEVNSSDKDNSSKENQKEIKQKSNREKVEEIRKRPGLIERGTLAKDVKTSGKSEIEVGETLAKKTAETKTTLEPVPLIKSATKPTLSKEAEALPDKKDLNDTKAVAKNDAADGEKISKEEADYKKAYNLVQTGDYAMAEAAFVAFINEYPKSDLMPNALYWLAETYYTRQDFERAVLTFRNCYLSYPKSKKAEDSLLKMGLSQKALRKNEEACFVFTNYARIYPDASPELKKRAAKEAETLQCK